MSTVKTKITNSDALGFLKKQASSEISRFEHIAGGEWSQAFGFSNQGADYIIRFNKDDDAFKKDKFAHDNYSSLDVPIPKILEIGSYSDELFYCISKRAEGVPLDLLSWDLQLKMIAKEMDVMHAIHKTPIKSNGYGWWLDNGNGFFKSWKEYILEKKEKLYAEWDSSFRDSFLKKEVIENAYKEINNLLSYIPEDRYLVHSDLGWSNEISDGEKITGVLDWGNSCYGDFLYDVSYKHFWSSDSNFLDRYLKSVDTNFFSLEHSDERIRCYLLRIGVGVLEFYARSEQKEKYDKAQKRIEGLLSI